MTCSLCQERPATSRGLCSACYQRERKAGRLAARMNNPLESDEGVSVADMAHWCHPSAEMVAESSEVEP